MDQRPESSSNVSPETGCLALVHGWLFAIIGSFVQAQMGDSSCLLVRRHLLPPSLQRLVGE